jgi:hypothetical protein
MVTIAQMQRGMTEFIDRELIPHLSGMERIVVGGGGTLIAAKLPEVLTKFSDHPLLSVFGLIDKEHGTMDIDAVYNAVKPYMGTESFPVKIPIVGVTLKMGHNEINQLLRYIKES